jgi:hypothetical protein
MIRVPARPTRPACLRLRVRLAALAAVAAFAVLAGRPAVASAAAGDEPEATLAERIAAAITRHEAAAAKAARAGQPATALGHWASILRLDPTRDDARRHLEEDARTPPPLESPALADARADLPRGFREERTAHFVVLTDADPAWSLEVGRRLERAHREFEVFTRRLGLEAMPLRHRLVCVVFRHKRDFERFGREHDGVGVSWAHGYFSPRSDRVVLYDPSSQRSDRFAEARAVAALMHETAHQLSFHRLVQDVTVQYPLWLNEGLATSFECAVDDAAAGPWEPFDPRERRLARLVEEDRLVPLREFVGLTTLGRTVDAEAIETTYGQCYGLFSWLVTTRPARVRGFLEAMQIEPPGPVSRPRLVELFETHIGSLASTESAWIGHLRDRVSDRSSAEDRRNAPVLAAPAPTVPVPVPARVPDADADSGSGSGSEPPRPSTEG